ncbi:MAG: hypothetical protein LLG97_13620 [Deltaproteobacteria bacterium]|nr:hypothetical protein [Deltaproteobacteria bacterium]
MGPQRRTNKGLNNHGISKKDKKKDGLNEIEKRFLSAMRADPRAPQLYDENSPEYWPALRERMKTVAYHEAGHFAAQCFTQDRLSHIKSISIIPNEGHIGSVKYEGLPLEHLKSSIPPLLRIDGTMSLLFHFAGYGTEIIMHPSKDWENFDEDWESFEGDSDDEYSFDRDHDYVQANKIAEVMANTYVPANRILTQAKRWTLEMLMIPEVWNAVEIMSNKLIECGEFNAGEVRKIVRDLNVPWAYGFPRWKRRLFFTPLETKKYVMNADEDDKCDQGL